jgi:hypothetical protein
VKLIIGLTLAFFIGVLLFAWLGAERAHPQMIDVDPAAVHAVHGH